MSSLLVTLLTAGLTAQAPVDTPRPATPAPERPAADGASPDAASPAPARPTEAQRRRAAQKAYQKGQKLYRKSRYRAAITALKQALDHWPYREIHFNLALCYRELKDPVGAYRHLRHYLMGATPKERRSVPREMHRLRRLVGVVVVHSSDAGTEIWIGGRLAGSGRVERVVTPGPVVVEVKRNGKTAKMRTFQVPRGGTASWDISLGKIITVKPRRRRLLHWRYAAIAAGVAVAATAAAIGFGARTAALHREFDRDPTWSTRDQGLRFQTLTNVMWGLTGAAVLSTAALAIFTRWRREKPTARVLPVVTPTGVAITGVW